MVIICIIAITIIETWGWRNVDLPSWENNEHVTSGRRFPVAEATNINNPNLHYGVVIDCGSSGSRVYVYFWPPHDGTSRELLNIQQVRDKDAKLVVKKIEPGKLNMYLACYVKYSPFLDKYSLFN